MIPTGSAALERQVFSIAFDAISLEPFNEVPAALRTEAFFRANELFNAYVEARSRDVVQALERTAVAPGRAAAWQWLEACSRSSRLGPAWTSAHLRELTLREAPALTAALDLVDAAAAGYPEFLRGERSGSSILFDPASPGLWDGFFSNHNPIYGAGNLLAAHAAVVACRGERVRVLEVGAGGGSGAEALLDRLGSRISTYRLTDIAPSFLRRARERIDSLCSAERLRGVTTSYQLLNLNSAAGAWSLAPGSFDLVYGVNVLHAVRDLDAALRSLRSLLAPGGTMVLGECVRPGRGQAVHPEFIFQLLDELLDAALDPALRPNAGFLDEASWRASLAHAGFTSVRFVPELGAAVKSYPAHSLAAIVAAGE